MNDYLTYKIGEVEIYVPQVSSFAFEHAAEILHELGDFIGKSLSEILKQLQDYFAENEQQYEIEQKRNKLRAIKAIKPTHKAPVYKIIPYVRNRC